MFFGVQGLTYHSPITVDQSLKPRAHSEARSRDSGVVHQLRGSEIMSGNVWTDIYRCGDEAGNGSTRSFAARVTKSASESAFIFRITCPRCAFTVISLMPSSPPTCLLSSPVTTSPMTWHSRGVSDA